MIEVLRKIWRFAGEEQRNLVNTIAPVHIRQDSLVHNVVAKFVKLDGETEDYYAFGDALMYGGVRLKQAFGGTGYNGEVRHFPDFASRMYFMAGYVSVAGANSHSSTLI